MLHAVLAVLVAATGSVHKAAVLDMADLSGGQAVLARQLTQVMVSEVAKNTNLKVISSEEISRLLGFEKQRQLLGCDESSCMAELAGALGVDYLVFAQIGMLGTRYRVDIRVADARRASLLASTGDFVSGNVDDVADATVRLTRQVLADSHLDKASDAALLAPPAPRAPAAVPAAVVAPLPEGPSHRPAYVAWGIAGGLAVAAAVMTAVTVSTYNHVASTGDRAGANRLTWEGPVADGLWAGTLVAGGVGAYFYFTASPSPAGAGGELGVAGRF